MNPTQKLLYRLSRLRGHPAKSAYYAAVKGGVALDRSAPDRSPFVVKRAALSYRLYRYQHRNARDCWLHMFKLAREKK